MSNLAKTLRPRLAPAGPHQATRLGRAGDGGPVKLKLSNLGYGLAGAPLSQGKGQS